MVRKRGQPRHQKTDETIVQARTLGSVGVPHHQAATLMGISIKTLLKYYGAELAEGKAKSSFNITKTMYSEAIGEKDDAGNWKRFPNMTALIYWTKTQMGWREASILQTQHLGADGKPVDPPRLGISFEDGGPGRPRRLPYNQEADELAIKTLPVGADKLN
jgi:hypothetical protein